MAGAPKVRIADATGEVASHVRTVGGDGPQDPTSATRADGQTSSPDVEDQHDGATRRANAWLTRHFPGHEYAALGGMCGLLVALLVFSIGLLRTLLIVVLVVGGVTVGQLLDGDARIIEAVRRIVSERRG